jgi:hypothetical protein
MACRVFIGLPEAAFYPGAIYLLSRWYTKKVKSAPGKIPPLILSLMPNIQELAFRSAILYAGLLVSNAFGAVRETISFICVC